MRRVVPLALLALAAGCGRGDAPAAGEPSAVDSAAPAAGVVLVDTALAPAVGGEDGWSHWRTAVADLDGDGAAERVVVTARVELYRGRPAWDDGQPWQVYVEAPDGTRTYVYARYVQMGILEMRLGLPEGGRPATIVLVEHLPDRIAVYEATYAGPGRVVATTRFERRLDPSGELAGPALP